MTMKRKEYESFMAVKSGYQICHQNYQFRVVRDAKDGKRQ